MDGVGDGSNSAGTSEAEMERCREWKRALPVPRASRTSAGLTYVLRYVLVRLFERAVQ
jgi:hypothetical protein